MARLAAAVGAAAVLIPEFPFLLVEMRESAVTISVFGSDVRRRTVLFGRFALIVFGVFIVGAIIGAWAGVVRIWPVRYSLQLIDGLPKPFVSAPESRPFALDSAGRLMSYAGKIEVPCPRQTAKDRGAS